MPVEEELKLLLDGGWKKKNRETSMMLGVWRRKSREEKNLRVAASRLPESMHEAAHPHKIISLLTTRKQSCAEPKKLATIPMDAVEPHFIS